MNEEIKFILLHSKLFRAAKWFFEGGKELFIYLRISMLIFIFFFFFIFRDIKQPMNRHGGVESEDGGTRSEEGVHFIGLQHKPEKGILKKHGGYGIVVPEYTS